MKFKDAYKSMTDEIHGNKALMHSILNGEKKREKSFSLFLLKSRTFVAFTVCVLLITTVFISYNQFNHLSKSEYSPSKTNDSQMTENSNKVRQIEAPPRNDAKTNSEYYGDLLSTVLELVPDKSYSAIAKEGVGEPLDIFIKSPSNDFFATITISKNTDLKVLIPNASYATKDGISIAVSSDNDDYEKDILQRILK